MEYDFNIQGHGWIRKIFYIKDSLYYSFDMPGGGELLKILLEKSDYKVVTNDLQPPIRKEYIPLKLIDKKRCYFEENTGWEEGSFSYDLKKNANTNIIYDQGLGYINIPDCGNFVWASNFCLPEKNIFNKIKDKCLLILTADLLRKNGALISKQVSWERSSIDLIWQLNNNPKLFYLKDVSEMLVFFEEDACVYIKKMDNILEAELILAHGGFEGELREKYNYNIPDTWSLMVAYSAIEWNNFKKNNKPMNIGYILKIANKLLKNAYDLDELKKSNFENWFDKNLDSINTYSYKIPITYYGENSDPDFWCISSSFQNFKLLDLAKEYVLNGSDVIAGIPHFTCGDLTTVDRKEIESFQNIRNLMINYISSKEIKPISIAVFGAPGSGKSFGVTQIAKNLLKGIVEKLEFNVSQFTNQSDISSAFHQVRDLILKGKMPLVFFDEFDSFKDGKNFGWLKNFLMPMQDGKFKDDSGEHPIGRCILVFAGGTSSSFEDFCKPLFSEDKEIFNEFKSVKAPDFISRLRGTINILGPNPFSSIEPNYILRRAILLRSLIERNENLSKENSVISEDIIRAMLLIPKYKHGARSMEAIINMSIIEKNSWEPASLPFYTQLSLHVDSEAFIRLVLRDVILNSYTEIIAKAIHEDYLEKAILNKTKITYSMSWAELPEEIKKANREQAKDIPLKLELVQCGFDSGETPFESLDNFTEEEILFLSKNEHKRWMQNKIENGWVYNAIRNDNLKHNPYLLPWEDINEEAKQLDKDTVLNIIPLLKKAGLRVYRLI